MPWTQRSTTYNAFLSYAHEDSETAGWLHRLLSSYWVPGRRRRRIFHDRDHVIARSLDDQIERALREAPFLVVCWSASAASSPWVPREVAGFLESHPGALAENRVLLCHVGPSSATDGNGKLEPRPPGLEALGTGSIFIPDLRGTPARARRGARRLYIEAALALLAPLVGLGDREQVLRLRLRRQLQYVAAAAAILLAAVGAWSWRQRWLRTPPGLFHQDLARALDGASRLEISDTHLFAAAQAIGRLGRGDLLKPLSTMFPEGELRDLFLVSGYVSLPHPDCDAAKEVLENIAGASWTWPEPLLLVDRICGSRWADRALGVADEPSKASRQAQALARNGFIGRALVLARRSDFPASDFLSLRVAIAEGRAEGPRASAPEVARWLAGRDQGERLFDALELIAELEKHSLQASPLYRQLLSIAFEATPGLNDTLDDNWEEEQRLAAHLALGGEKGAADHLLAQTAPGKGDSIRAMVIGDAAVGWAWRGLAFHRLQAPTGAASCFDAAERIAARPMPASRTWGEWGDLLEASAKAGDWTRAFRAVEAPRDERERQLLRCRAIEIWVEERSHPASATSSAVDARSRVHES